MKKALFGTMVCLALFGLVLTGCDDLLGAVKGKDVTEVILSPTTLEIEVGNEGTLTATVSPSDADNKTITWTSSNPSVATVTEGVVLGKTEGIATITAKSADGPSDICKVTVKAGKGTDDEPGKEEPGKEDPGKEDPGKEEPGKEDPGKEEPGKEEPGKEEPGKEEPGKEEPGKEEPGKEDPGKEDPGKEEPGQAEASVAITGIPLDLTGLASLGIYQAGTTPEELVQQPEPLAGGEGTISKGAVTIELYSADGDLSNGSYVAGLVVVDDRYDTIYGGYATVTFSNQKASIAFSAFTEATDMINEDPDDPGKEDPGKEEPGQSQASATISSIRSDLTGLAVLSIYPADTTPEDLANPLDPLAEGYGPISQGTADIGLSSLSDSDEPWYPANGDDYVAVFRVSDDATSPLRYEGYAEDVTFSNQKASIPFSAFTEATDMINGGVEEPGSYEPGDSDLTGFY
jgi:hypothetical protein